MKKAYVGIITALSIGFVSFAGAAETAVKKEAATEKKVVVTAEKPVATKEKVAKTKKPVAAKERVAKAKKMMPKKMMHKKMMHKEMHHPKHKMMHHSMKHKEMMHKKWAHHSMPHMNAEMREKFRMLLKEELNKGAAKDEMYNMMYKMMQNMFHERWITMNQEMKEHMKKKEMHHLYKSPKDHLKTDRKKNSIMYKDHMLHEADEHIEHARKDIKDGAPVHGQKDIELAEHEIDEAEAAR